jgi:hypothetical protein
MKYWTTERGQKLLIEDMSIIHLSNAIKFIERKIEAGDEAKFKPGILRNYINVFKEELRNKRLEQLL